MASDLTGGSVVGCRLGVYQVLSLLGIGGMGEVYRARDTRLGRDVALKVLPAALTTDPDRLARLEREARALAALNHPNIATIYGVEDTPVDDSPRVLRALVLELVEGETLAERIAKLGVRGEPHGLPLDETLAIARQIADALDAAHEKGIVHRDLKPANVKITPEGVVKVLDFGLAKLAPLPGVEIDSSMTAAPTQAAAATREGVIVGTTAYMSPEQARGQAIDKRTDIWAFGCMLYELLVGRSAFARATITDTLAAILEREPDSALLPTETPPALKALINRCLRKDPRQRIRDIGDVRIQLDDLLTAPASSDGKRTGSSSARRAVIASFAVALFAVAAVLIWSVARPGTVVAPQPIRYSIDLRPGEQLPIDAGLPVPMAIAPNGRQLVYSARGSEGTRLYLRRHDTFEVTPIVGTEGGIAPFFSPDARSIGFVSGGSLMRVALEGGSPQTIAQAANVISAAWTPDDTILYSSWNGALFRVPAQGGTPQSLTALDATKEETTHRVTQVLANGATALMTVDYRSRPSHIDLVDVATGRRRALIEGRNGIVSRNALVFARGDAIFTASFHQSRQEVTSAALRQLSEVAADSKTYFVVADDGALAYVPSSASRRRLVWTERDGTTRPLVEELRPFTHPRISPDGQRVLVQVSVEGRGNEFWIYDVARGARTRLSVAGAVSRAIWTSDGKRITFQNDGSLYSMPADDSGDPTLLLARDPSGPTLFPLAWSRSGHELLYSRPARETNRDVMVLSADSKVTPLLATPRDERAAMFSPDGRWIVYAAQEPGRGEEVYLQEYPGSGSRVVVSRAGGVEPVWSPKGDEIFYRSIDGRRMMAVPIRTEPAVEVGAARLLFEGPFPSLGGSFWSNYDVVPDGQRFLMVEGSEERNSRINVALHWVDGVQR